LAIVIPAFNEAATINSIVERVAVYGQPIVVCDNSTDGTGDIAERAGASVVRHTLNLGYDGALQSGFSAAIEIDAEIVVTIDADGQLDPSLIPALTAPIESGHVELVLGVRPHSARLAERLFNFYGRFRFGVSDLLCGMKAYKTVLCQKYGLDGPPSIGTKISVAAIKTGIPFDTVAVTVARRTDTPRFGNRWQANMRIMSALWNFILWDLRT
jgi:glycosyltransferase involved in cell wall biosynthesis